jgi:hypothetical protein
VVAQERGPVFTDPAAAMDDIMKAYSKVFVCQPLASTHSCARCGDPHSCEELLRFRFEHPVVR